MVFKIVDLYSEMNEKRVEFMRVNMQDFFGETYIANLRRSLSPKTSSPKAARGTSEGRIFTENRDQPFIPSLRGVPIVNRVPPRHHFARTNTCPLAKKISSTLDMILRFCPIGGPLFFPIITDNLSTLESFLTSSSSRIIISEFLGQTLECLIHLKSVFMRLHDIELKDTYFKTVSHRNSPRRGILREERLVYPTSAHGPSRAAASVRDASGSLGRQPTVLSERIGAGGVARLNLEVYFNKKQSVLFQQKEAFSLFLKIIAELQLRARGHSVIIVFSELFILDPHFDRLCVIFAKGLIQDHLQLVNTTQQTLQRSGLLDEESSEFAPDFDPSKLSPFTLQEQKLFLYIKQVLDYYKHQLIFCKLAIFQYRVNDKTNMFADIRVGLKRQKIPGILKKISALFDPTTGPLWDLLNAQSELMSKLAKNSRFQTIKDVPTLAFNLNLIFNLFSGVVDLLATAFSVKCEYSDFLGDPFVSHYLRTCYFGFVKIYSYISNEEIVKINQKVMSRLNEDHDRNPNNRQPDDSDEEIGDQRGSLSPDFFGRIKNQKEKERIAHDPNRHDKVFGPFSNSISPDKHSKKKAKKSSSSFPIQLSKIYLRVVLNMALNKNETIKNVFHQYRVMELLYKEVDLEFEASQIKERFLKVRDQAKKDKSRETSPVKNSSRPSDNRGSANIGPSQNNSQVQSGFGIPKLAIPQLGLTSGDGGQKLPPNFKLNLGSLKPKETAPAVAPSIPSPKPVGNMFALDFSKLAPRGQQVSSNSGLQLPVPTIAALKPEQPQAQPVIPPLGLGVAGVSRALSPPMIPKLGVSMGVNLEKLRGTDHSQPSFIPSAQQQKILGNGGDSSDSSSIEINYDPSLQTPQKPNTASNQPPMSPKPSKDSSQRAIIYNQPKQAKPASTDEADGNASASSNRLNMLDMNVHLDPPERAGGENNIYVNIYTPQYERPPEAGVRVASKKSDGVQPNQPQYNLKRKIS